MPKSNAAASASTVALIEKLSGMTAERLPVKPATVGLARLDGYPSPDLNTLVTLGLSADTRTMWRGLCVGFELTLTARSPLLRGLAGSLIHAATESIKFRKSGERRAPVEYNGLYAPGYAPHLFFCDDLSLTPSLKGQHKVGERYVEFLAAIPITDSEMRQYDRSVAALIKQLSASGQLADYKLRA